MKLLSLILLTALAGQNSPAQQRQNNPAVKETLRWMQTSLENGGGDYYVGHEVRSTRLEDFVGCKVHFVRSTSQVPFVNEVNYFFSLGDIDPTTIELWKGQPRPSIKFRTRNGEKKITIRFSWQSETKVKPDSTWLLLELEGIDTEYADRFTEAFTHAVKMCGGKPSFFTDSDGGDADKRAPLAAGGVAAHSALLQKDTRDPSAVVSQTPVVARSAPPRKDIPAIAKAANGAIVSIVMSDKDGRPIAQGSGFLISTDGRVVTNYHVVHQGSSAVVKLPDGAFYVVDGVLAFDKARDVAVIKAHGENFRTLTLGNSDRLQVGEEVVAIGNPLSLESTVSNGIMSGIRTSRRKTVDSCRSRRQFLLVAAAARCSTWRER